RIVVPGNDALPQHHLQPTLLREELVVLPEDPAVTAKQIDLHPQSVGDLHAAAVIPERRVVALGGLVMDDDEVPDALVLEVRPPVELVDVDGIEAARGEEPGGADDGRLNEVSASGLARLEAAARKPERHEVRPPKDGARGRE